MKFPVLHSAIFIKRNNRFTAEVRLAMGDLTTAHVPTTGRLTGALRPGCRTWLEPAKNPGRRTPFTLVLSELQNGGLCSINAMMANRLFNETFLNGNLEAFSYERIEKEVTFDRSRLDFRLSDGEETCWVEVKSITFATNRVGMFPDAPTSRGRKHLGELWLNWCPVGKGRAWFSSPNGRMLNGLHLLQPSTRILQRPCGGCISKVWKCTLIAVM